MVPGANPIDSECVSDGLVTLLALSCWSKEPSTLAKHKNAKHRFFRHLPRRSQEARMVAKWQRL
jgi:hypothetical protein